MDTSQIRFLESASNLKTLVHQRSGRELSTTRAREIAACLQQGRQFFESASSAPLEIRPLIQFYGLVGFAKAVIVGTQLNSLSTLAPSHGLRDVTTASAQLAELTAHLEARGTFAEFNEVVAQLNRFTYTDANTHPAKIPVPTATSSQIAGLRITFKDVVARLGSLSKLYQYTFGERASAERLGHLLSNEYDDYIYTRVHVAETTFDSRDTLVAAVRTWRERFPYLDRWTVVAASSSWGSSYVDLANLDRAGADDLSEEALPEAKIGDYRTGLPPVSRTHPMT